MGELDLRHALQALESDLRYGEPDYNEGIRNRINAMLSASEPARGVDSVWLQRHRRERIATAALQGAMQWECDRRGYGEQQYDALALINARIAIRHADALIAELDK